MSTTSSRIRALFKKGDEARDAGLTTPAGVVRYNDIAYGTSSEWQQLDVYLPEGTEGPLPTIVSVHGGGWVYGDKERYQWYCLDLATRGFAVVNFSYRLAPEFKFPASMEDTCAVFAWTLEHAEEYSFDREHIFAAGDSAGAHMLGLFCGLCADPAYAAEMGVQPPYGFMPRAVALNCGAYHISLEDPESLTNKLMADFLPNGGDERELALIEVLDHVSENFPPTYLMTSDGDFLRQDTPPLAERLTELKVMHETHIYAGIIEPLPHVFHLNIRSEEAKRANDDQCTFFKRFL